MFPLINSAVNLVLLIVATCTLDTFFWLPLKLVSNYYAWPTVETITTVEIGQNELPKIYYKMCNVFSELVNQNYDVKWEWEENTI